MSPLGADGAHDVLVVGEPLLELTSGEPLETASGFSLSFSGDALNAAAAAAAAGADTALLTRVGADALSARLVARIAELGVTPLARVVDDAPTGAYVSALDPGGAAEFVYLRQGSAASGLVPDDLDTAALERTRVLLVSGITAALSPSAEETVLHAARTVAGAGGRVVYDPNFRPRLTSAGRARAVLERIAPSCSVVTPSCPGDAAALVGDDDPAAVAAHVLGLGAGAVVVTRGEDGVLVAAADGGAPTWLDAVPVPLVVDQTGAGDALAGTLAARLAAGDPLLEAARLGTAAAALSLAGAGGTGRVPTLGETRAALAAGPRAS